MVQRKDILDAVASSWWEKSPRMMEFVNHHLSPEGARIFAPEHTFFAAHFPRWFANVIGNCPVLEVRRYIIGNIYVEEVDDPTIGDTHYGSMVKFGEGLGLSREAILSYVPSIPMRMGVHYWDNVSRTRPWLEGFAAVGALELTNHGALAARYGQKPLNSRRNWAPLGLDRKWLAHWEAADAADPDQGGHAEETIRIIVENVTGENEKKVLSAVTESIEVFRYVYDTIGDRAIAARDRSDRDRD
ncbi:MAG TPA: iron-containing redox enzyme family protein [Candidatus Binatia bacterium]